LYSKQGDNWDGLCKAGNFQSPINIVQGLITKSSTSQTAFSYKVPKANNDIAPKLYFDGDKLYLEADFGTMTHISDSGATEHYQSYKVEIHLPSEHYITQLGQTPRAALEIQLYHKLLSSDQPDQTNQVLMVKQSIVSILFTAHGSTNDKFLNALGINQYNKNESNDANLAEKNSFISYKRVIPGSYDAGFTSDAFQGLINIIDNSSELYFYYGSESQPPCNEEVFWQVFSKSRSISMAQYEFLYKQLAKRMDGRRVDDHVKSKQDIYGNKRNAQPYNPNFRQFIKFNEIGSVGTTVKSQ